MDDQDQKQEFLEEFGDFYDYPNAPKNVDQIRATEFKRLNGNVYLDHAGATLYSELQMEAIFKDLSTNVYGNPHSQNDSSSATSDIVSQARQQVLDYFNASAKDYRCVFTSGATAALKLVGEAFPWSGQSCFAYTRENHNSVLGIREYALGRGASAFAVDIEESMQGLDGNSESIRISRCQLQRRDNVEFLQQERKGIAYNLFAFPSECNFSGCRFNLHLVKRIKEDSGSILEEGSSFRNGKWMVLIDAAKGSATEPPDLSQYPADFVVTSFYKLFGYPTGLGALIVRNDAAKLLKKSYFSGGTVAASIADIDFVKPRNGVENLFEDGTLPFLSIAAISHGFKILKTLTMSAITRHTASLACFVRKVLLSLRHGNGGTVCTLYGIRDCKVQSYKVGPIVSFNLIRPDGSWYGYREVEKLASLSGIQLRTGCFCNPGACAKYLGLSHTDLLSNVEAGHVCWDDHDIVHGKPTGAVRVSFGYMSTYEDAKKFLDFVARSFVASSPDQTASDYSFKQGDEVRLSTATINIKSIIIYPIKSCGGFITRNWPLSSTGLRYDREWVLTSLTGETLTQKKVPEMCFISTLLNLDLGILYLESPNCKDRLQIKLSPELRKEEITLHGQRYEVMGYDDEVNNWFSNAIGQPCTLLRFSASNHKLCPKKMKGDTSLCRDNAGPISFANEAQLLLISEESTHDLNNKISAKDEQKNSSPLIQVNPMRFRPNIVISGGEPYAEDQWRNLCIGLKRFTCLGGCNRCQMINLDLKAGCVQKSKEPLATLASYRRLKGKILFGILLKYESGNDVQADDDVWLRAGEEVHPNCIQ